VLVQALFSVLPTRWLLLYCCFIPPPSFTHPLHPLTLTPTQVDAGKIKMPSGWEARIDSMPTEAEVRGAAASPFVGGDVDYRALVAAVEAMDATQFADLDLDELANKYAKRGW